MTGRLAESRFWDLLWRHYATAPSIALCRVPELEYASAQSVQGRVLDHCCGDGIFASLAWPGCHLTAGCDIDARSLDQARRRGIYGKLDHCDAAQPLPFDNGAFDLIFDNSALEHIADLDAALREVARVLAPTGIFAFNVLNHRYFEWWPLSEQAKLGYRKWQPFIHALSLAEWRKRLEAVGLDILSVEGYLHRNAARELARLEYAFSSVYLGSRRNRMVSLYLRSPQIVQRYWRWRVASLTWKTEPDAGAGYFIRAGHAGT